MSIIPQFNIYDQLISRFNKSSDSIHLSDGLATDQDLHVHARGESEIRIVEEARCLDSRNESIESIDPEKAHVSEELEKRIRDRDKFHSVPKSFIQELGSEAAAVLYGFSLVLKNHKSNKVDGLCWYYDTLDQLILKRWPYLKRTSLYEIVRKLENLGYLLISKENRKGYDQTMRYSMYKSRIDEVLEDQQFWFDVTIAKKTGVLGALIFHNVQYRISHSSANEAENEKIGEYIPKIPKLAEIFNISESTVKRQLKSLVNKGLLEKGKKKGSYTFPITKPALKNRSNPNEDIQKWPESSYPMKGSNPNEIRSNPNEEGSFPNEIRSNPNDNTIYETNWNHISIQMRSAPRVFLKKEETEESNISSIIHSGSEQIVCPAVSSRKIAMIPFNVEAIFVDPATSDSNHFSNRSESPLEAPEICEEIDDSRSALKGRELGILNQHNNQSAGSSEISVNEDHSDRSEEILKATFSNFQNVEDKYSRISLQEDRKKNASKSILSFGRKIEISNGSSSKFQKIRQENSRIEREFSSLTPLQRLSIQDSFLRLGVRFIESLNLETRGVLLDQNSPDKVLDLIFESAYNFIESKNEEFKFQGEYVLSQDSMFPLFPFLEIIVRGVLLFGKPGGNSLLTDEFTIYSVFEALSFEYLDSLEVSSETKALFFNFMILRAKATKMDNNASNGKSLDISMHQRSKIAEFSSYTSEIEFQSLVHFFRENNSVSSEEVFFKYSKSVEWRISVDKNEDLYEKRWHSLNFKDISQFLRFYPKISQGLEDSCYDFESSWKRVGQEKSCLYDEYLKEEQIDNLLENQLFSEDLEHITRISEYFRKVKSEIQGSDHWEYTPLQEVDFKEALLISKEYELAPEDIVDLALEVLGNADSHFSTIHLRGSLVKKALKAEIVNNSRNTGLVTDENLEIDDVWIDQLRLLKIYIRNGEQAEDVLLSSSLNFLPWFRILVTEVPNPSIIEKYQHAAARALDYKIKRFIRRNGLDLSRICE